MHDDAIREGSPEGDPNESGIKRTSESLFSDRGISTAFTKPPVPSEPDKNLVQKSSFQRVVLPVALLIGAIAAIAWVTQYLPNWQRPVAKGPTNEIKPVVYFYQALPEQKDKDKSPPRLTFRKIAPSSGRNLVALWNYKDDNYFLEFEKRDSGHYDIFFLNESDRPAEVSLNYQSCRCNDVKICVLPPAKAKAYVAKQHEEQRWTEPVDKAAESSFDWTKLDREAKTIVEAPPGKGGILRLSWTGSDVKTDKLNMSVQVWSQPKGSPSERHYNGIRIVASLVPPVVFYPSKLEFGSLPGGSESVERDFWCWSSTRDSFDLRYADDRTTPCIQCEFTELSREEHGELLASIPQTISTRVKHAYQVTVSVAEKRGGQQLDMGLLHQEVPVDVILDGKFVRIPPPMIRGLVPTDVRVGPKKSSSIRLGTFSAQYGVRNKVFPLFTNKDVKLEYVKSVPATLSAALVKKRDSGNQTIWELKVSVLGGGLISGPLENWFVLLQSSRPNGGTRQVRIPVEGTAESSKSPF